MVSKLEQLIKELCPNGVEYYYLEELECNNYLKLGRGQIISKDDLKKYPGEYPVFSSSAVGDGEIGRYGKYMFDDERITWSIDGGGKFFYRNNIKYSVTNVGGWLKVIDTNKLSTRYLFHTLVNEWAKKKFNYTKKAHPSVIKKEYYVPVPPIEVQEEIVRILDKFTLLTEELTAELTARKEQYEYYNNNLLKFENTPYFSLEELCDIVDYRGKTPKKTSEGIFLVTAKNIRKGYIDYEKSKEYISKDDYNEVMRRGIPQKGDVLITTEAPCGNVAQVDNENIALAQRVIKYRPKDERLDSTFLKYILLGEEFQTKLISKATGGTVKGIKGSVLHKIIIPLPSIEKQKKIVEILKRFDKICNDISEGLPAEIEARQKQYEYYRDRLLTFKMIGE